RLVCAGYALQRHRGAETGLYPDRTRQGPRSLADCLGTHPAQRRPTNHRNGWHRRRLLHGQHRGRRIRVRLAGDWPVDLAGHPTNRHSDHHGSNLAVGLCDHSGEPARRLGGAPDRSQDQATITLQKTDWGDLRMKRLLASVSIAAIMIAAVPAFADMKQGGEMTVTFKDDLIT